MSGRWETGVGASVVPGGALQPKAPDRERPAPRPPCERRPTGPPARWPGDLGVSGPRPCLRDQRDAPSPALPPGRGAVPPGAQAPPLRPSLRSQGRTPPSPPAPCRARPPAPGPGQRPPGVLPEALPGPGPRAYWFSTPCRLVGDLSLSRVTAAGAAQKCPYSRGVTSTRRGAGTARGEAARAVPGGRWRGSYRRRA